MVVAYIPAVQTDCVVDTSHAQNLPNPVAAFAHAKVGDASSPPIAMIIQKASQGVSEVDETYRPRRAAAAATGLLFCAYHFCDGSEPIAQAKHFLATIGDPTGIVLFLDAEKYKSQTTVAEVLAMAKYIQRTIGRLPGPYMGRDGPNGRGNELPNAELTSLYAASPVDLLWLAEYGNNPVCPPGFKRWALHQYTGDGINGSGYVAGLGSKLDRSRFAGSVDELKVWHAVASGASKVATISAPPSVATDSVKSVVTHQSQPVNASSPTASRDDAEDLNAAELKTLAS